jgi:hypothetical protein
VKNARIICTMFGSLLVLAGVFLLGWTERYLEYFGAVVPEGLAMSNMRAVFGGLQLGLGIFVIILARKDRDVHTAARLVFWIFGGLVFGRICEIAVNGFPEESFFLTLAMLEITGMVGGFQAMRHAEQPDS